MKVCMGVIIHDGKVLFIRRGKAPYKGMLSFPGGKVEEGETIEEAIVREIKEETDLDIEYMEKAGFFEETLIEGDEEHIFKLHVYRIIPEHFEHVSSNEGELVDIPISEIKNYREWIVPSDYRMVERVVFNEETGFKLKIRMEKKDKYVITNEEDF